MDEAHLILYVRDQAASRSFYAAVLEREPFLDAPGMCEFRLAEGAVLGLMPTRSAARLFEDDLLVPPEPSSLPKAELYLVVSDPEAHHRRALAEGASELSPLEPRDWGHRAAYSLDPDGHVLAFAEPL